MTRHIEAALRQVERSLRQDCGLAGGEGLVVAVSGGPDSMTLLTLLKRIQPTLPLRLHALYLDHALQGEVSARAGQHVLAYCQRLGIPGTVKALTPGWHREPGEGGLQARAREARYHALRELKAALGFDAICTGHTRSDQGETVLARVCRGTGLRGLGGMRPRRGDCLRPMLALGRGQIQALVEALNIPALEDPSNHSPRFERNRLRHAVLPLIEDTINPQVEAALNRLAFQARRDEHFLESQVSALWQGCQGQLTAPLIQACHPAIGSRLLRRLFEGSEALDPGDGRQLGAMVEKALGAIGTRPGIELTRNTWLWEGHSGALSLGLPPPGDTTSIKSRPIPIPGLTHVPEVGILLEVSAPMVPPDPSELGVSAERILLDFDALSGPLRLRGVQPGDRFRPFKGAGSKKVNDYFTDIKLDIHRRRQTPLILDGDTIVWVVGLRQGSHAPLTDGTRRAIAITCRPSP